MSGGLSTRFNPRDFEPKWQSYWEKSLIFRAPVIGKGTPHYTILLPPPNVTGVLTLGHSLGGTCMDVLVRMHRMKGVPTLFLPGVDHAGLATQMAVRKSLEKRGVDVRRLPREEFLKQIDSWRVEKEDHIRKQLTSHGFSLDWSRYVYTMTDEYQHAVMTAFIRLFREGLIHRAERMVNWDPKAMTAVSDLEVIPTPETGKLWFIKYPAAEPGVGDIVVATTRPETMFGDVAVAVNPKDERHQGLIGKSVKLPLTDRVIPVIADEGVDPTFGNGALKVTPSHDFTDQEIAKRHPDLPSRLDIMDERAHLSGNSVPEGLRGLSWLEARKKTLELLGEQGLMVKEEPYSHNVGYSERSNVPIEPRFSKQWFVDTGGMGVTALAAVKNEEVKIYPYRWTNTYYHFMENLQDWCISRQVIWGHRIPVWYCDSCGHFDAFETPPTRCSKCGGENLHQDPDVLDTWFSSWLWPFATLGWPGETSDAPYYPASVLVTGSDIVFFWVARMLMGGLKFKGQVPFPHVYLTGILVDKQGRKLSKSLGNSPDPLEFIEKWGADSYRFALMFPNPVDVGGYWDYEHIIEGSRNFITKIWNLVRLLSTLLPPDMPPPSKPEKPPQSIFDRWLLSRLRHAQTEVEDALAHYEFTQAASALYQFVWREFADWYVEAQKERLKGASGDAARRESAKVALFAMDRALKLLHPFIPHATEELWHALPHEGGCLAESRWPQTETEEDTEAEQLIANLQEVVKEFRTLRRVAGYPEIDRPVGQFRAITHGVPKIMEIEETKKAIVTLSHLSGVDNCTGKDRIGSGGAASVTPLGELFIPTSHDRASSRENLLKEKTMLQELLRKSKARLADPSFNSKAPPSVVAEINSKVSEMEVRLKRIDDLLKEG